MELSQLRSESTISNLPTHERILRRTSEIVERNRQLMALNSIATSVSQSLNLRDILDSSTEMIMHLMDFEAGWIALVEKESSHLVLSIHRGMSEPVADQIQRVTPGEIFIGAVAQSGEPLVGQIPVGSDDELSRQLRRDGFSFFVAIPLKAKSTTLGVMALCCRRDRQVDRGSSEFLSSVGDIIGVAIENASLYHNIAQLAEQLKARSEQLEASEHKYRSLIEKAKDAVILIQDGRICYANRSAADISGHSLDDLYQLQEVLGLVREEEQAAAQEWYERLRNGENVATFEVTGRRRDNSEISLEVRGSVIEYEGRPATQFIIRDVHEQKLLREQMMRSEKMAALGQLISGVAHELNNPLTVVVGYSELLGLESEMPDNVRRGLDTIQEAAQRAGKIVQNLLTFARQHQATQVCVKINELIERTLALRAYEMGVNNIEVVKDLGDNLPETVADPHQLQQVFLNLIVNAEQAMMKANGRGQLWVQTREKSGAMPISQSGTRIIQISITDDGPGIDPTNLKRIFEPFFTTKPVGEGTGLGLSISHGIIRSHGGRINVQSEIGHGTTFTIELPVVDNVPTLMQERAELPPRKPVTPKNVLIIDDEVGIVNLLRRIVTEEGHQVMTAANGSEALTHLQQQDYDLIFCDYKMPRMNGQELYHELERQNGSLAKRMIFVTGDTVNTETRDFLASSGSRVLEKPFITEEIVRLVRNLLADN